MRRKGNDFYEYKRYVENFFSFFQAKYLEEIKKAVSLHRLKEIRHTKQVKGRLAQLVQSICLTSRGSA
ncbi:MAG: hypothetical protein LUD74_00320, partial [Tannerellaceae bacterium]|nr:hypothetical protein [Tannerellaceae bacterium]